MAAWERDGEMEKDRFGLREVVGWLLSENERRSSRPRKREKRWE